MENSDFVGVIPPLAFETLWFPKRLILMFDRLALDLNKHLNGYESHVLKKANPEIEWMADEGLLTTLTGLAAMQSPQLFKQEVGTEGEFILPKSIQSELKKFKTSAAKVLQPGFEGLRYTAADLRTLKGIDAIAVGTPEHKWEIDEVVDRSTVVRITLSEFPMPADNVPWEQIIDFKSSGISKMQFHKLKVWMNKISRSGVTGYEVLDELKDMLLSYSHELNLAKMKSQRGFFEVVLTTTAEVAENLVRIKPSEAVKSIFKVSQDKIKLLEEEKGLNGREVAYLITAQNKFKR